MIESPLTELVKKSQRGDAAAFEEIVRATMGLVYSQVVAVLRDRQKAEDATQEVFLAAWKAIGTVKEPNGFASWLTTLARNRALDTVKSENRLKRKGVLITLDGEYEEPSETLANREAQDRAIKMLQDLPEDYRRPLMMRYLAGCDHETIRRTLNLTDGTLRGQLSRGMTMLREMMKVEK